jgi:hypothetical protein
MAIGA